MDSYKHTSVLYDKMLKTYQFKTHCKRNGTQIHWTALAYYFACRRKVVHLCFIMSPGKMIFAVLEHEHCIEHDWARVDCKAPIIELKVMQRVPEQL